MQLFLDDAVNVACFDPSLRQALSDLNGVLVAASETGSSAIESTHFLMCLPEMPKGATAEGLRELGIGKNDWKSGLASCVASGSSAIPLVAATRGALHDSAMRMLEEAGRVCEASGRTSIDETVLLFCALGNLTPKVRELCGDAGIDLERWRSGLERLWRPVEDLPPFGRDSGRSVARENFSKSGRAILDLIHSEGGGLGAAVFDARHLALALLNFEGGALHSGLLSQGIQPGRIKQAIMLNMPRSSSKEIRDLPMVAASFQSLLRQILEESGRQAGRSGEGQITEKLIACAFLTCPSATLRLFENQKVNLDELRDSVRLFQPGDDEGEGDASSTFADIETIERRLRERIVGQDEAVSRILPHVQRFRFGFRNPSRPVGVFLFCGQSGSGKTEMAKELARSVFGTEENLIFLEMGQFNSPESMNIFVGAAPGYVGYGEGQLTNGLRDKPKSVVLFDEVEKAHARVLDALLRFLDEGRISDPAGPVRDGSQCIVILTSNVGAEELGKLAREMRGQPNRRQVLRQRLREELKARSFRVEFLNRVDEIILFSDLTEENYAEIARRHLDDQLQRLKSEHAIEVVPDPSLAEAIGAWCAHLGEGARAAHRLVQSMVVTPVIDQALRLGETRPLKFNVHAVLRPGEEPEGMVAAEHANTNG